jgi:hypothetical protein
MTNENVSVVSGTNHEASFTVKLMFQEFKGVGSLIANIYELLTRWQRIRSSEPSTCHVSGSTAELFCTMYPRRCPFPICPRSLKNRCVVKSTPTESHSVRRSVATRRIKVVVILHWK